MEEQILPYSSSRFGIKPSLVVVHWSGGTSLDSAIRTLKQRKLSYHYIVDGDRIVKLVDESRQAWHAGNRLANLKSVGVCFVGIYERPVLDASYAVGGGLISDILKRMGVEPSDATIRPHKAFKATACPGSLDLFRLIGEARKAYFPPPPVVVPVISETVLPAVAASVMGEVIVKTPRGVRVRQAPDHNGAMVGALVLKQGQGFTPVEVVSGTDPYGDGRNQWYRNENNEYTWKGAFE